MMAVTARDVDLFSVERAGLWERLGRLAGRTDWRDPQEPWAPGVAQAMTVEDALNAACVWLRDHRKDATDVSGDVLHGLALQRMARPVLDRCVDALAAGMVDMSAFVAKIGRVSPGLVDACCRSVIVTCVSGHDAPIPPRAVKNVRLTGVFMGLGTGLVWAQATEGIRRASEALA